MRSYQQLPITFLAVLVLIFLMQSQIYFSEREAAFKAIGIFSSEYFSSGRQNLTGLLPPFWTPTEDETAKALQAASDYLSRSQIPREQEVFSQLSDYQFQYAGAHLHGRRILLINALCNWFCRMMPDWKTAFVTVLDGGTCFFKVYYDIDTQRIYGLVVNGQA